MEIRYQIEMWMTIAFALYLGTFFLARMHLNWRVHVWLAVAGFAADMYATYLMFGVFGNDGVSFSQSHILLRLHVVLSLLAIFGFFFQAWLGIQIVKTPSPHGRILKKGRHSSFAVRVFLPIWVSAYVSGFALALR